MYPKLIIIIGIFILGLYFVTHRYNQEGFDGISSHRCPNVLIQEGSKFSLFNSKIAKIPGVNPIQFDNLNEYVEFTDWQRSQGIRCPVLYLQQSYDIQNNPVYKARPDPENLQGGAQDFYANTATHTKLVDASRDDPPYNTNSFPGYDQENQNIGLETPLDKMFNSSSETKSANAMDTNWGGEEYSENLFNPRDNS
tara:strand:- start:55 stop:642 length:588 start_codon:yes stop_codon:yes gene_type:complete